MATQQADSRICRECGAKLAPDLRYCLQCYRPVAGPDAVRAHVESAREIATTRRVDPTIVFSPEKHEAIVRRVRRRKRLVITAAAMISLVGAGAVALQMIERNRREAQRMMAREEAARRDLNSLAEALERFRGDVERYPTNEE